MLCFVYPNKKEIPDIVIMRKNSSYLAEHFLKFFIEVIRDVFFYEKRDIFV